MEQKKGMSFSSRKNSFLHAFHGFGALMTEPNAKIHAIATIAVIAAGFIRHVGISQWIALIFAIGLVWVTEAVNTCVELLCDYSCDNKIHPAIKKIKDVAAAAVLLAALTSAVIGIIVFLL